MYAGRWGYTGPAVDFNLGDEASDLQAAVNAAQQDRLSQVLSQMAVMRDQLQAAKASGDTVQYAQLQQAYLQLNDARAKLVAGITSDSDLTAIDKLILDTGNYIDQVVSALPGAIAAVPAGIGKGIIGAIWPFALIAGGLILFRREARK